MVEVQTTDRFVAYRDVGSHNTTNSARVVFEGMVYDVTDFIAKHPGGRDILVPALGTDITNIFHTIHGEHIREIFVSGERLDRYGIRVVGELAPTPGAKAAFGLYDYQSRRLYNEDDPLWDDLNDEVHAYLQENQLSTTKSHAECVGLLLLFYSAYALGMWMAFIQGSVIWALLLGPITAFMASNPAHTAIHGGFSSSKSLNKVASLLMDFGGYSEFGWAIEHLNHHESPHSSVDVQTTWDGAVRFFGSQPHRNVHRYQMLFIWLALPLYAPRQYVVHTYNVLFKYDAISWSDRAVHLLAKLSGLMVPVVASFFILGVPKALLILTLFLVSTGYNMIFLLYIQHEDSYMLEEADEPWAVRQVLTSTTWHTRNRVLEWMVGYFNYHIEHHLFPGLNPSLYPKIQPIVMRLCEKHGVQYKDISYYGLVRSQLTAWRKFAGPVDVLTQGQ